MSSALPAAVDAPVFAEPPALAMRTDLADELATPLFVEALAAAILRYGAAAPARSADLPLQVYDLAPGQGTLAVRLLRALGSRRAGPDRGPRVRLHLCASPQAVAQLAQRHALLRLALDRGEVVASRWDPRRSPRPGDGAPLAGAVFIALGYFQQLPVQWGATHYGQWLQGGLECSPPDGDGDRELHYRWSPCARHPGDATLRRLRRRYQDKLGSVAVNLPHVGVRVVQQIARCTAGRYLLLAADHGATCLRDIATGALTPPPAWRDGASRMPVNFDALAAAQPHARMTHLQSRDDGPILHVALAGAGVDAGFRDGVFDDRVFDDMVRLLGDGADHGQLMRDQATWLAPETPLPVRLAQLRRCGFDPHLLRQQPGDPGSLDAPDAMARKAWHDALQRSWILAQDEADPQLRSVPGLWAAKLGVWGLAVRILQGVPEPLPAFARDHLAWARMHAGDIDGALATVREAGGAPASDWHAYLDSCQRMHADCPWYVSSLARDGDLSLEPLAAHHAAGWMEQYRDPDIGIMTRLPELPTLEATQAWIAAQQADASRAVFAVVHREHGFVGSTCYQRAGDSGYFHFWIGIDHQGLGYGRRAGQLVCAQAAACGVQRLFTSVYLDNRRSRAALAVLGFELMPVRAMAPDDDLLFLRHARTGEGAEVSTVHLTNLLAAMESPIRLVDAPTPAALAYPH